MSAPAASAPPEGVEGLLRRFIGGTARSGDHFGGVGRAVALNALATLTARLRELDTLKKRLGESACRNLVLSGERDEAVARLEEERKAWDEAELRYNEALAENERVVGQLVSRATKAEAEVARLREAGADAERYCGATCDLGLGGTLRCGKSPHPKYVCHYDADRLVTFDDSAARRPAPGGET